ncbi:alpha/beta hydrolase fold protein [Hyphomicrobium denitrificans 1NES1]|uniref:Alpha/beta hydrolase fold protein n=1 Tax=Hyphomicrobium denitrificans 1NES1 TaxID=670307 RepID=N0B5D7_9HYPH|nr:alpha/beta fold hydrolase [Hyphomicrobium denitrificans]AGK57417.1 alpha/beta hydrolase fold protein [Hyphomicrobium denitrificans 1NES1]
MATDAGFKIKGGKVGILLLHRLCGTPVEMRFVASGLAKQGYTVHCPTLAGHCGSEDELKASSWTDWYRSAELALDDLKKDCDVVIAGGLSAGAVLAILLAAKKPTKVDATALLAPTLWLNGWMIPWYARLFRLVRFKWFANLFSFPHHDPHGIKDERIRDFIRRARASRSSAEAGNPATPGGAVFEHRQMVNAVRKLVAFVRQPTLIVHPLEDDYAAMSNATYLRDSLGGPVNLEVLDDCYHVVTVDRQRHLVVDAIDRFVANLIGVRVEAPGQRTALGKISAA